MIELLVVVSIIVILVAILVPALKGAVYAAQLAACGVHQKGIGTTVLTYAADNKRYYPIRKAPRHVVANAGGMPVLILISVNGMVSTNYGVNTDPGNPGLSISDDRPIFRQYGSLKILDDPLCDAIDYDDPQTEGVNTFVFSSYDLWWDYGYNGGGRMTKVGSSITWKNPISGKDNRWNVLATDRLTYRGDIGVTLSGHPDRGGKLVIETSNPRVYDDQSKEWASGWNNEDSGSTIHTRAAHDKLSFDRNFLYDDGSVTMIRETKSESQDKRLTTAPWYYDGRNYPQRVVVMPANAR